MTEHQIVVAMRKPLIDHLIEAGVDWPESATAAVQLASGEVLWLGGDIEGALQWRHQLSHQDLDDQRYLGHLREPVIKRGFYFDGHVRAKDRHIAVISHSEFVGIVDVEVYWEILKRAEQLLDLNQSKLSVTLSEHQLLELNILTSMLMRFEAQSGAV